MKKLITIWFLFSIGSLHADSLSLEGHLSLSTIEPGQKTYLSFIIPKTSEDEASQLVVKDEPLTDSETFKVLERDTFEEEKFIKIRYGLTLYQSGNLLIPPLTFELRNKQYQTDFIQLNSSSTRLETDENLRDPFPELPLPWPWEIISLTLLVGALSFFLIHYYVKKRSGLLSSPYEPAIIWNEWVLQELALLQSNPNLDRLTFVIKKYLKEKNRNPIDCLTSRELEKSFLKNQEVLLFLPIFKTADESKFSPLSKALNLAELIKASEKIVMQCN